MQDADDWHLTERLHTEQGKGDPFAAAIRATRMPMIITSPRLPDNPIVFANRAFLDLTGYRREEVMGRNCRLLQGPGTDGAVVAEVRAAIEARHDVSVDILNYRKDGTPFWNALYISPVVNEAGELLYFFASQLDITHRVDAQMQTRNEKDHFEREVARRTSELTKALAAKTMLVHEVDHRVKNNLQMMASLLLIQIRNSADPAMTAVLSAMLQRVQALGTVHRQLYQSDNVELFDVSAFTRDLATDLVRASGRADIDLTLELEPIQVATSKATPIALMLNELVTNALKHAYIEERGGRLSIEIKRREPFCEIEIVDDGVGMPNRPIGRASFGKRLVETLARQLDARIAWRPAEPGTRIDIKLPLGEPRGEES